MWGEIALVLIMFQFNWLRSLRFSLFLVGTGIVKSIFNLLGRRADQTDLSLLFTILVIQLGMIRII